MEKSRVSSERLGGSSSFNLCFTTSESSAQSVMTHFIIICCYLLFSFSLATLADGEITWDEQQ